MSRRRAAITVLLFAAGGAVTAAAVARPLVRDAARPALLLPDLRQEAPRQLGIETWNQDTGTRYFLSFASQVDNVGAGPLILTGTRTPAQATMRVHQLVRRSDGTYASLAMPGAVIRYRGETGHHHWHLQPFNRYRLVDPSSGRAVSADQKVGFCLGDRDLLRDRRYAGAPAAPVFRSECGRNAPQATHVRQGLSVGYGDDYPPTVDFQFVEVTHVPAGVYRLVFTVNGQGLIRERTHANDTSTLQVRLSWPDGTDHAPTVTPLRACAPPQACPAP